MNFQINDVLNKFGVHIDENLLITALTHCSFSNEHPDAPNNERLEFLGDSILSFIVTEELYRRFDNLTEGELSVIRSKFVSTTPLAEFAIKIGLNNYLLLGKGETKNGGSNRSTILENAFEALVAAIYLSNDLATTRNFIMQFIIPKIEEYRHTPMPCDHKTQLQKLSSKLKLGIPIYKYEVQGQEHETTYIATISFANTSVLQTCGVSTSKKKASLIAAEHACSKLTELMTV